ncbi:MAG: type III secretion system gatekeeper subunit SctW [Planctomycetota bacterium]|jgi:type III secretion protein W|nr:type III secretion system gatekeeper subunit SctW [Planctomycetota bacterium]
MTTSVNSSGFVQRFSTGPEASSGAVASRGEWNGLAVEVANDPMSLLQDAAEELTFAASETVEKDVSERKKADKGKRIDLVVPAPEAMARLKEDKAEQLAKMLAAVRLSGGSPAAFREALSGFTDPTERHAALLWLEDELAGDPSLAELAREERVKLETQLGVEIQAGYNVGGVAGPEDGKDCYRRTILGRDNITTLLDDILERYGTNDFVKTVEFLRQAVGADLSAARPSIDKRELESMNNDLYQLRALANFTNDFTSQIDQLREKRGKTPLPAAGMETLRLLCRAKDQRLVMLDNLAGTLELEGKSDPTYDVQALTRTLWLAQQLPPKLFGEAESRERLLVAGQKILDRAIDLEESLLEE